MLERARHVANRMRELGAYDAARWWLARVESGLWERYLGVDTVGAHRVRDFGGRGESVRYEPLPWLLLRRTMAVLPLTPQDVFLDYGSGMGRVLITAARQPAKRVVGVELLAPLAEFARENAALAGPRLHSPIEVVVADASTWEVPDDVTVVFLFNPFVGSVMAAVQARIEASLKRRPRRLRVLYAHPEDQPNLFAGCDWLRLKRRVGAGIFEDLNILLYEHDATPDPPK